MEEGPGKKLFMEVIFQALEDSIYHGKDKTLKLERRRAINFFNSRGCQEDRHIIFSMVGINEDTAQRRFSYLRRHPKELENFLRSRKTIKEVELEFLKGFK